MLTSYKDPTTSTEDGGMDNVCDIWSSRSEERRLTSWARLEGRVGRVVHPEIHEIRCERCYSFQLRVKPLVVHCPLSLTQETIGREENGAHRSDVLSRPR